MESSYSRRTTIFISYSHKDAKFLQRLLIQLDYMKRQGLIDAWNDQEIKPGENWQEKVEQAIASARIAVLLISADFLASSFIMEFELPILLEASKREGMVILPVLLSHSEYEHTELAQFQVMNDPSKPLSEMPFSQREKIWKRVAKVIRERITSQNDMQDNQVKFQYTVSQENEALLPTPETTLLNKTAADPILSVETGTSRPNIPYFQAGQQIIGTVLPRTERLSQETPVDTVACLKFATFPLEEVLIIVSSPEAQDWLPDEFHICLFQYEEVNNGRTLLRCQARSLQANVTIAERLPSLLEQERQNQGLTVKEVANHLDVSPDIIIRWEKGEVTPASYYIKKISKFYGKGAKELGLPEHDPGREWGRSDCGGDCMNP